MNQNKISFTIKSKFKTFLISLFLISLHSYSQNWSSDGNSYYRIEQNEIKQYSLAENSSKVLVSSKQLTPQGATTPLEISHFSFSNDQQKVLLFTNTIKVWRLNTKGDYWILDLKTGTLAQLGKSLPAASLMFAKFSPDNKTVAYVSNQNIYVENLVTSKIKPLTTDGSITIINGTFDWVYEEEFSCRDGFRWSPDSKSIAYWQIDSRSIKKFTMLNNTASIYPIVIPIEYPKVGEKPSICKVGVVTIADAKSTWMKIPGVADENYLVRMEFIPNTNNLIIQQLNRKQNQSSLYVAEASNGNSKLINKESDTAWIDVFVLGNPYDIYYTNNFTWTNNNKSILWASEKDGWRHLYQISLDGKSEKLVTKGNYDVIDVKHTDDKNGNVYFLASPDNATQKYLYRTKLDGSGKLELLSSADLKGTHDYNFSTNGKYASHTFSNHFTKSSQEMIVVENQKPINEKTSITSKLSQLQKKPTAEFFKITTKDGVEMDGWMVKPKNFDATKKYPLVFYVYSEPAGTTVSDNYGSSHNRLYNGSMIDDGYIYISLDNRGTPAPKGREWRKSIYRKIGRINIQDQAMAATEILKWNFVDPDRVAVWGWSGGGAATLNLMFQYPEIYKTGIAIAAITNQLTYDNIYQERYMGLPQENKDDFINGSPITYAKNLKGNLLYIHGTGDDNVHYQNAELLINELVKYNKQFQIMPYPNRSHSIN
ncbi:DPP IV N-terminal domain-containing protein, partial [Flavobacterium sp.]|uniref:S9 family peptidase n=1 Tax=Flavobacterium sp. TaxID=239 RepID=UPI0038FC33DF